MEEKPLVEFIPRDEQQSEYDWANITLNEERVGKARCKITGNQLTIFSINIYPEYEGHGYGRYFVEIGKEQFDSIIADRVRFKAIGFWEKLGFRKMGNGNYIYEK